VCLGIVMYAHIVLCVNVYICVNACMCALCACNVCLCVCVCVCVCARARVCGSYSCVCMQNSSCVCSFEHVRMSMFEWLNQSTYVRVLPCFYIYSTRLPCWQDGFRYTVAEEDPLTPNSWRPCGSDGSVALSGHDRGEGEGWVSSLAAATTWQVVAVRVGVTLYCELLGKCRGR